uniref:NADH-ubiquinone oxidoreductase chain 6 n=1 Tax=Necrodes littoralis TaxID=414927 RepID=A0A889ZCS7_NECLI|nr:NADH dehydrogenase subunit 6 [Necrodes littoralis]QRF92667.1 NADH dehydrogenase subunit 6 [Necrodes littoralis]
MIMMMMMSLMLSFTFIFMSHPLSMGLILLSQTILIALISGIISMNFWFSYILFLIMIGGMLVLFIYMTSVASNEKFKFSILITIMNLSIMILFLPLNFIDNMLIYANNLNMENIMNEEIFLSLSKFFNYPSSIILMMMIIYLFITLIAVVKITNISYGPLRQKF